MIQTAQNFIAGVNGNTVEQQGMGLGGPAVISEHAQARIGNACDVFSEQARATRGIANQVITQRAYRALAVRTGQDRVVDIPGDQAVGQGDYTAKYLKTAAGSEFMNCVFGA